MTVIRNLRAAIRFDEWWDSEVASAATVALSLAVVTEMSFEATVKMTLLGTTAIAALAAFGYGVNDVADAEADRRSSRRRAAPLAEIHPALALLRLAALVPLGLVPAWILGPWAAGVEAFGFLLAAAYSLRPLRLKERGLAGILASGCGERLVPTALFLVAVPAPFAGPGAVLSAAFLAWAALVGVRWNLVHQILDSANDRRAGLRTWVTRRGEVTLSRVMNAIVLPLEAAALALILIRLTTSSGWVALGLVPAVPAWFWLAARRRRDGLGYGRLPLEDVYELWLPLAVMGALSIRDPRFILVSGGYLLLFQLWALRQAFGRMRVRHESSRDRAAPRPAS